jgi:hypothetical protein
LPAAILWVVEVWISNPNHGFSLKNGQKRFLDFRVFRAVILLRILFAIPEAESQDSIVIFV